MNSKSKNIYRIALYHLLVMTLFIFSSCVNDSIYESDTSSGDKVSLQINLASPASSLNTRSQASQEIIDIQNTQVLVFEALDSGEEVFRYKASIVKNNGANRFTIEAKTSSRGEKYRFVVITHGDQQTIADGTSKLDALSRFKFAVAGKWNMNNATPQAMPLWGETTRTIEVKREQDLRILLHMALAKVDVGLNFKPQTQDEQTTEVIGLSNFKLKSVRVYRTKNLGHIASSFENMDPTHNSFVKPHIPTEAEYNLSDGTSSMDIIKADQMPLYYEVDLTQHPKGADKLVQQIFIPESYLLPSTPSMDEVPCLVVGGYYGEKNIASDNPVETFYRMDFADYKTAGGAIEKYKHVLRNNRYVFNIRSVANPGFPDEETALRAIPANIDIEVQVWSENLLNFQTQGKYHFGVENREVEVPTNDFTGFGEKPNKEGLDDDYVWTKIAYSSNLPITKDLQTWKSSGTNKSNLFELVIDDKYLWFGAVPNIPQEGVFEPNETLEDIVTIKLLDMEMTINVKQEALNTIYLIDCSSVKVNGKYREGAQLDYTHTMDLTIRAPVDLSHIDTSGQMTESSPYSLKDLSIHIYTEKRKGIYFEYKEIMKDTGVRRKIPQGTGFLDVWEYTITLQGYGIPTKDPNDRVKPDRGAPDATLLPIEELKISANSVHNFGDGTVGKLSCETRVIFGYKTKKILTIGSNANYRYGYVLEPNTASRAFVDASINFGVDPNSTVTMDQYLGNYEVASARNNAFDIRVMSRLDGMLPYTIDVDKLSYYLTKFRPDIIIVGYATDFKQNAVDLLDAYLEDGGVLIMNTEYYPFESSIRLVLDQLLGVTTNGENRHLKHEEFLFKLPDGPAHEEDAILNGPFGDLRGKHWGTDGYSLFRVQNLPSNTKVYNTIDNNPCFFKYEGLRKNGKPKAFVFNGDGGFISNPQRYIGPKTQVLYDYLPFAINAAYQPIPRENFLRNDGDVNRYVYNSQLFGNILTWAVDYAENYGYNVGKQLTTD